MRAIQHVGQYEVHWPHELTYSSLNFTPVHMTGCGNYARCIVVDSKSIYPNPATVLISMLSLGLAPTLRELKAV